MAKKYLFSLLTILGAALGHSFEKLPPSYQIAYGDPNSPIEVVEYFSFSCPKCLKLVKADFETMKEVYIKTGKVRWVFHPDPADKLTHLGMICLAQLDDAQKRLFFETVSKHLDQSGSDVGCIVMQAAMEYFQKPLPDLGLATFWERSQEFQVAFAFLKQKDVITSIPTVEINGRLADEFPSRKFLEKQFSLLLAGRRPSCE